MQLSELVSRFSAHPNASALAHAVGTQTNAPVRLQGLQASALAFYFAAAHGRNDFPAVPYLFIKNDEEEAGYLYHDLVQMLGETHVLFYPSTYRRAVKYAQRDAANEILRTDVLERLSSFPERGADAPLYIVTYPAALAERVAPPEALQQSTLTLRRGGQYDLVKLAGELLEQGFSRKDYVYEPGEFAVRGSILDVYSYASEYPFRIDFFGDDVDTIRTFEVQTQLSKEQKEEVTIVPDTERRATAGGEAVSFFEYLPKETRLVARDFAFIADRVQQIWEEGFARQARLAGDADSEMALAEQQERLRRELLLIGGESARQGLKAFRRIYDDAGSKKEAGAIVRFHTSAQSLYHKNFELLRTDLAQRRVDSYRSYILADSGKQNERLAAILSEMGETDTLFAPIERTLHAGFVDDDLRICLLTDHQIFDRFHKYSLRSDHARDAKMALSLKELMQFEPGDYIVHIDHGVGRFAGLVRMPGADGQPQEMIKLTFRGDDAVYVSIHSLHKVSKYKGKEGEPPRISALGTGAWEKLKERTKRKIKDIARDLIRLYSERRHEEGFAFSADSFMQHELEASFPYEDTPDQLRVTTEVKQDMESRRPMDRLVCGDVGFGKTEIAVRAAMKAAADNKQVAVLVPTTVLALQHYKTFAARLRDFPVRVDYLTRARTTAQTKQLLKDLAEGRINILVGTHKLIGKNVRWNDLGLLIIDEEQKFGVAVKERLRQLKTNVDTLTMSATPIPRTLQFSLMGARDFSVIQTPPPNRRPIQTEIHTFNRDIIGEAVNFEMSRSGQTYIVTNRISALPNLERIVRETVPDARIAVGHGQMAPAELERIVTGFVDYDYDVLISTTIVENGIDVPNANTIIIDAAHRFGLSDLHQMRGRVGRSSRKAFCYLLAPPLALLPDESRRRLEAIENYSDLGSGIHIAMQDLDIRGAGNLLGAEQSGFIADLGYETYQKILAEAVAELKNDEFAEMFADEQQRTIEAEGDAFVSDCTVECDLHAYFPETYVPGATERMMLYRELDTLDRPEAVEAFRQRMLDRFGPLPPEGEDLLRIVPLRALGRRLGTERLVIKGRRMTLYFVSNADSPFYRSRAFDRIIAFASESYHRCRLDETNGRRRMTIADVPTVECALVTLQRIVEKEC